MKTGIFGGSFDPPHIGHLSILKYCEKSFGLEKIIIVPTGIPPHKNVCKASARQRFEMCRLAFGDYIVSDYETNKTGYSYSADMLEYFKGIYPNDELYFIIGGDSAAYIDKWHEPERIFAAAKIIVAKRNADDEKAIEEQEKRFGIKIYSAENPLVDISSTNIREKIKESGVVYGVTDAVKEYIIENNLYR